MVLWQSSSFERLRAFWVIGIMGNESIEAMWKNITKASEINYKLIKWMILPASVFSVDTSDIWSTTHEFE